MSVSMWPALNLLPHTWASLPVGALVNKPIAHTQPIAHITQPIAHITQPIAHIP
jgi:hypothetical protein